MGSLTFRASLTRETSINSQHKLHARIDRIVAAFLNGFIFAIWKLYVTVDHGCFVSHLELPQIPVSCRSEIFVINDLVDVNIPQFLVKAWDSACHVPLKEMKWVIVVLSFIWLRLIPKAPVSVELRICRIHELFSSRLLQNLARVDWAQLLKIFNVLQIPVANFLTSTIVNGCNFRVQSVDIMDAFLFV